MQATHHDRAKLIGARIAQARGSRSQEWLAGKVFGEKRAHVRRRDIIRYEKGEVTPSVDTLARIAEATGKSVAFLYGEEEDDEESDVRLAVEHLVSVLRPKRSSVNTEPEASPDVEVATGSE